MLEMILRRNEIILVVIKGGHPGLSDWGKGVVRKTSHEIRKQAQSVGFTSGARIGPRPVVFRLGPQNISSKTVQPGIVFVERSRPVVFLNEGPRDGQFNVRHERGAGEALNQIAKNLTGF